ncbi:MAG TPA: DUF5700 domain-containing putative Zn-dependent protease [Holophagaceae bacterium]
MPSRPALVLLLAVPVVAQPAPDPVDVRLGSDEAEAVLAILARRAEGRPIEAADWDRLFQSEGYRRLARREASLHRPLEEAGFRAFVLGPELLAQAPALRSTLARWEALDIRQAAAKALAYLPEGAAIRARIYPVIKPAANSFVFEGDAIFLALDPAKPPAVVENILAHELHHIGYASVCPDPAAQAALRALPEGPREAYDWISAFGEGFAMLAAAGGPDVHPHAVSPVADRARWDHDLAQFDRDLRKVEAFLVAVAEGRLKGEAAQARGMAFFGIQGPWYTVGWRMAVTIERAFGRPALLACMQDPRRLLPAFNRAVAARKETCATWSPGLLQALSGS